MKKKEGETSAIYTQRGEVRPQYHQRRHQQVSAVAIPVTTPPRLQHQQTLYQPQNFRKQQQTPQNFQQNLRNYNQPRQQRIFEPVPISYSQLLQHLLQLKLVTLRAMPTPPEKLLENYNANARCDFHSRGIGHDIENCLAFKHKVQDLLDAKAIQFSPDNGPNVIQNPMPPHAGPSVNAVEVEQGSNLVRDVRLLKTPLLSIKDYLIEKNVFPGCLHDCYMCQELADGCDDLKNGIHKLISEGSLQCEKVMKGEETVEKEIFVVSIPYTPAKIPAPAKPVPLTITVPSPIPYSSEKAVPWHYGSDIFYHGGKTDRSSQRGT